MPTTMTAQKQRYRLSGYVQERFCQACDTPGVHYTLLKHKSNDGAKPMMQLEVSCTQCTYNWVETYEGVPNSWMDHDD